MTVGTTAQNGSAGGLPFTSHHRSEVPDGDSRSKWRGVDWPAIKAELKSGRAVSLPCRKHEQPRARGFAHHHLGDVSCLFDEELCRLWVY